jgi:dihydroorotate dehydrogenase/Pyruvate/2-oxoacid:ferredoxin oxidoreductase delta subunit
MAKLSVEICGLKLRNPILTAAGPAMHDASALLAAAENGAGGLVTNTITRNPSPCYPYLCKVRDSILSATLSSFLRAEDWVQGIAQAKKVGLPLIASVGFTLDDVREIAPMVVEAGADAVEVSVARSATLSEFREMVSGARKVVPKPLFFKLNTNMVNLREFAQVAQQGGADGLTVIDAVGPVISVREDGFSMLGSAGGEGWLSGPSIKPLALRALAEVCSSVSLPVLGTGGISDGRDAAEFIMMGAWAVEVNSASILRGPKVYGQLIRELLQFMQLKGHESVEEMRGAALRHLPKTPFTSPKVPELLPSRCTGCGLCVRFCLYGAVKPGRVPKLEASRCTGCGLCVSVCPAGALRL